MAQGRSKLAEKKTPQGPTGDALAILRSLSPFKLFADEELREIVPLCEVEKVPEGVAVLSEGDPSNNRVYFLLEGAVAVTINEKFILGLKREGDIFGEMSLISDEPRSATVRTTEPSRFLAINSALTFDPGQQHHYKFRYYFSRMFSSILTDKLKMTSERAKMYEDAVLTSRVASEKSTSLQEQIRQNLLQIRIYTHLVGSAKDTILIINTSGAVLEGNPSLQTEFGLDPGGLSGRPLTDLLALPAEGPGSWPEISRQALQSGWSGEVEVRWEKTENIPADCSISIIRDPDGDPLAFSVILRNIHQRKLNEQKLRVQAQELERANVELKEMDRLKDNFIGLVSHELRTPLSSIIAYAEALSLEGMVEPEDQGEFLKTIHSEALELAALVNKMVAISKIESGQMVFDFAEARLDELLAKVGETARQKAALKNLKFSIPLGEPLQPTLFDETQLGDALREVLSNAVLYTERGLVAVRISQDAQQTVIEVQDTGKGMDPEQIAAAFNRFEIVKNVTYHQQGIGLGLPLAHLIVKSHGGRITLASSPGKGTTVSVALPHQPPQMGRPA